ncbi:hypothetical protein V7O61_08340 [Methanolobus sp. WCC1]|uniref:hypothetical protein n=1 Tax=unclassified Methanolobus TaxID=2629569 RepID=UPI00324AAB2C
MNLSTRLALEHYDRAIAARKIRRGKDRPITKKQMQSELEKLKAKVHEAEWDVAIAEDELATAEAKLEYLQEEEDVLKEMLDPLLRPWERPRPEKECNLLYFGEGAA